MLDHRSSSDEKIALFRSLFRGRADVYPRRFESRKTGKSGYAPACANEWVRGVCESRGSSVRNAPIAVSFQSLMMSSAGTSLDGIPKGSHSSPVSIRCCSMRRVSSSQSTSTGLAGRTMPPRS